MFRHTRSPTIPFVANQNYNKVLCFQVCTSSFDKLKLLQGIHSHTTKATFSNTFHVELKWQLTSMAAQFASQNCVTAWTSALEFRQTLTSSDCWMDCSTDTVYQVKCCRGIKLPDSDQIRYRFLPILDYNRASLLSWPTVKIIDKSFTSLCIRLTCF